MNGSSRHLVEACVLAHADGDLRGKPALTQANGILSYEALGACIRDGIPEFARLGISRGDIVFVALPDSPDFVVTFFAAMGAGACPVPLSESLSLDELALLAARFGPRAIVVPPARVAALTNLARFSPGLVVLPSIALAAPAATPVRPQLVASEFAYGLLTSGTTGTPKLVQRRHGDIAIGKEAYAERILGLCECDIVYTTAPFCFGYGLGSGLLFPLLAGATVALRSTGTASLAEDLSRRRPNLFFSQPPALRALLWSSGPETLPGTRLTISAGERMPERLPEEWLSRFGHPILDGYGTTEVGHVFISQTVQSQVKGSIGRAIPGFAVDVVDGSGAPRAIGQPGLLRVHGPAPLSSYFRDEVASSEAFLDDAIVTADLARISSDNDIFVLGRGSDFAVLPSGKAVLMSDLDQKLLALTFVQDGYIAQHMSLDSKALIGLSVWVTLRADCGLLPQFRAEVRAALRDDLDGFDLVDGAIHFVDVIPRNAHGKLIRAPSQAQFKC